MVDLACCHHLRHQSQRLRGHGEISEPGGQPGNAQNTHRVFTEGGADVTKNPVPKVILPTIGVGQLGVQRVKPTLVVNVVDVDGNRVDGQVAARQVVL